MSEDTRKDKRAKIVSLNVRYKSATVDEFIENHSHDVSKGGLFIKTPTPFPPGTLIKFEIRIANDRAVITGVGRVVWKREPSQAAGERPSGMGVKFIKIDDSSRQLIDRIVAEKEGAGVAFAADQEGGAENTVKAATRPISDRPAVESSRPGSLRPGEVRKETIMGIGASTPPPKPATTTGGGMFPTSTSAPEEGPVKEKTVMKQAAELLEEALREAGGSMDDIGNNPLFDANKAAARGEPATDADKNPPKATLIGIPSPSAAPAASTPPPRAKSEPPRAEPVAAKRTSEAPPKKVSVPPAARDEEPGPTSRQRKTDPPARRVATASLDAPSKSGGGMIWVVVLLVVAGGVAFAYKDNLLGGEAPAPSAPTAAAPAPVPTPAPAPVPPPAVTIPPAATSAAAPTAPAAPTPPTAKPTPAAVTASPSPPTPAPKPVPPPPTPAATPAPAPAPKPVRAPKPAAAATDDTAPTPKPAAKPKPKADDTKPAAGADDNPY